MRYSNREAQKEYLMGILFYILLLCCMALAGAM